MMKRCTILLLALLSFTLVFGQDKEQKRMSPEDYKAKQQAFITHRAGLTESEATAFFPLYFKLQREKMELQRTTMRQVRGTFGKELSEEEAAKLVDATAEMKIKCDQLEKDYLQQFKQIIPATKLLKVQMAEHEFQRELLRNMEKGKQGFQAGRGGNNRFRKESEQGKD